MNPLAVPSSRMRMGRPTTAQSNSAARTQNNRKRKAALTVNLEMAKMRCISSLGKKNFGRQTHFDFPRSDDSFSFALERSAGFSGSAEGAGETGGVDGDVFARPSSFFTSTDDCGSATTGWAAGAAGWG